MTHVGTKKEEVLLQEAMRPVIPPTPHNQVIALDTDASARKHLLEELRTLYRSQHPAIVGFYGAFLLEGKVSIALEYMDCGTLASLVEKVRAGAGVSAQQFTVHCWSDLPRWGSFQRTCSLG